MTNYKTVFQLAQDKGYKFDKDLPPLGTVFWDLLDETNILLELTLIQKWLRDEHKLHIYIDTTPVFDKTQGSKWRAQIKAPFQPFKWTTGYYYLGDTYEQALLEGIYEALKLIP